MKTAELIATECVAVRVRTVSRAVTALYDDALRPLGLRIGQLNLLAAISRREPARPTQVCRSLQMDKSTFSRDVAVLRRQGWLEVVPDEEEGRARPLRLSGDGRQLLEAALPLWRGAQERACSLLGEPMVGALSRCFDSLGPRQA